MAERRGRERVAAVLAAALASVAWAAAAQAQGSPACRQARQTVDEVMRLYSTPSADRSALLHRLATARDLCPSYGEAWKVSACLARDLGDQAKARLYTDRAVLNGVTDLACGGVERPKPLADLGPFRDKHALVVGIQDFADPRITDLQFTGKDAEDFYAFLVDPEGGRFNPSNVELLVDEEATRKAILIALQKIIVAAEEEDLVVIYVSSHGSPAAEDTGLKGVGYIVTYDTVWENLFVDALAFQDFSEKVSMIKARRKVTFLDTCYSGQAMRRGAKNMAITPLGIGAETARMFTSAEGSYLITSSSPSEESWESERLQNSYFTHYLLQALRRGDEPPTLDEVFADLVRDVGSAVRTDLLVRQTPQLHPRDLPADLRIGAPPVSGRQAEGATP